VGDACLHHECSRGSSGLRRSAREPDAALVDQVDQHRRRRQGREVARVEVGVLGRPALVGEADAEDECVVVAGPAFPEMCRQVGGPPDHFGQVEVSTSARLELSFERGLFRIDRHDGWRCDLRRRRAASPAAPAATARLAVLLRLHDLFVARPTDEVQLPLRCRLERGGPIVGDRVEAEHAVADPQPLFLPPGRIRDRAAVEVTLVGGNVDLAGVVDDDLAPRHQHLVERQRCDVGPPGRTERIATGLQRPPVACSLARRLDQRDGGGAVALGRRDDLDQRPGHQTRGAHQRACRCRPAVDEHEGGRRRAQHTLQQVGQSDRFVDGVHRYLGLTLRSRNDQVHGCGRDPRVVTVRRHTRASLLLYRYDRLTR